MDIALEFCDHHVFTPYLYPASWPEDNVWRQLLSLNLIVDGGGAIMYLMTASLSYLFLYDKELLKHPQILENQVRKEITYTFSSIPLMGLLTAVLFLLEVRGHSKLYDSVTEANHGWLSIIITCVLFLFFTDFIIYWLHRWLHSRMAYKTLHKPHHQWIVPTPFASHAFHPIDGFLQSTPYHIFVFMFPMHKLAYMAMYIGVNIWTVSIHDGNYKVPGFLKSIVNGAAHHMDHHVYYNYNYGQYLTLWDRIGGSFRNPSSFEGKGPADVVKAREAKKLL